MNPATPNLFTEDELDALFLGLCWAMEDEEPSVATAAATAIQKIADMLPEPPAMEVECPALNPEDPSGSYWIPYLEAAAESEARGDRRLVRVAARLPRLPRRPHSVARVA